jgi:hypothetical protein
MAFRNPIRSLPASAITGQIPGSQITGPVDQATNAATAGSATSVTGPVAGSQITGTVASATTAATASSATAVTGVGTVPYTALAVGTGNLVPDPSFEGAYAQTLTSASWTIDTTGNQSAHSLKVTSTVASGTKTKKIGTIPVSPGDKFYVATDYTTSSDWAGSFVKFYLQYKDSTGATIGFTVAQDAPTPGAAWKRISLLGTAPTNAASADIVAEHNGTSILGTTWFDNTEVRTAVVAGAIAAGLITAGMIAANQITGDKLVANTITGDLLDATAIDGKTITGSTVQTATSGPRVVMDPSGALLFPTGSAGELYPARIDPNASAVSLDIRGPRSAVATPPDYGLQLRQQGSKTTATLDVDSTTINGDASVGGLFSASNVVWGTVQITPVANTLTSLTVTGLNLPSASSYRVLLTANTINPDQLLAPLGYSAASSDGFTLWVKRSNNTPTSVTYAVLAK